MFSPPRNVTRRPSRSRRPSRVRTLLAMVLALGGILTGSFAVASPAAALTVPHITALEEHYALLLKALMVTERAAHGVHYIYMNTDLQASARRHDALMAADNTMAHQLPGEPYFGTRISQAGYHWTYAGENIAWNSDWSEAGVLALEKIMYNEVPPYDGHRRNILNPHFLHVGVDVYFDYRHHKVWITTDFGHP